MNRYLAVFCIDGVPGFFELTLRAEDRNGAETLAEAISVRNRWVFMWTEECHS